MARLLAITTAISSTLLRFSAYVFLRWIPGHAFPQVLNALAIIYVTSFFFELFYTPAYEELADGVSLITRHTPESDGSDVESETGSVGLDKKVSPITLLDANYQTPLATAINTTSSRNSKIPGKKHSRTFRTLITGLPSPASVTLSVLTFSFNLLLQLFSLDLVYTSHLLYPANRLSFARLGFVSDTSASILIREPDNLVLPIWLSYRLADGPPAGKRWRTSGSLWKHLGPLLELTADTDYTAPLTIRNLEPETRYEYMISNNHAGFFITAPSPGRMPTRSSTGGTFRFMHTSCIIPNFPYVPWSHPLSIPGFRFLASVLSSFKPTFMLFLGDFIYADLPKRHGNDVETYRRQYRHVYASPDYRAAVSTSVSGDWKSDGYDIPWIHTWDDHELNDNWEWNNTGVFNASFQAYSTYHLSVNSPTSYGLSYFSFIQGPASFFVMDTRSYRSRRDQTMLGKSQRNAVISWIKSPVPEGVRWKVLVSSVPFTKNWHVHNYDTWGGFLKERQMLLEAMWETSFPGAQAASARGSPKYLAVGIVILSGDRHEFAATRFSAPPELGLPGATVHEFSASPLSMFYLPVRTYWQTGPAFDGDTTDVVVKYLPDGNSKLGAVEIESPDSSGQSLLRYKLFVDGKESWNYSLVTPPHAYGSELRHSLREIIQS